MPHILGPLAKPSQTDPGNRPCIATPAMKRSWTFADSSQEFDAETVAPREFEPGTREMAGWAEANLASGGLAGPSGTRAVDRWRGTLDDPG